MPTLAKITAPSLPRVAHRTRLYRQLDNAGQRQFIWVTGPAGSGKTTLVASYLAHSRRRYLWYQIDAGDSDIASFFHYLGLAATAAAPRYRRPLLHPTPEYMGGIQIFLPPLF